MATQYTITEAFFGGGGGGVHGRVRSPFAAACRLSLARGRPFVRGLRAAGPARASGEDTGEEDHAVRETIKQSKRVLAVQRDLLDRIAERRRIISSIKTTIVNTEEEASGNESDSYLLTPGPSSANAELDKKHDNDVSDGYADSTEVESTVVQSVAAYRSSRNSSQAKHSLADALGLISQTSIGADETLIMSPSLSKISESIGAELNEAKESITDGTNGRHVTAPVEENIKSPPLAGSDVMNIILVAAECAPWSKTGGLGDVAGALPKALARRGHRVMVVAPMYGSYAEPQEIGVRKRYKVDGQDMEVSYFHAYIDGVDFVFLESAIFRHRGNDIYGGNRVDVLKRMVLFCKAAVEVPWLVPCGGVCYGDGNLVFIANDWHTALLPVYLKAYYRDHGIMKYARCVLVIHNIAHQGRGPVHDFNYVDLPGSYVDLFRLNDPTGGEHFNIFAAGLKAADRVVTVSHGYAWELKTPEGGWGLHQIISENDWKFHGIVNGVDTNDWNPKYDEHLNSDGYTNYSLETLETGKSQCKAALQRELGLPVLDNVPILAFIGRLDHQKGVDLIAEAIPWIVGQDVQLIMLGSGRSDLEDMLRNLENHNRDKVRGWVGFSVKMAHRITAGADVLLMPSRFEPCGLNQLYAMMYGTVPVVHAVGGLRDTVHQYDPYNDSGYGWTFERAEANRLIDALGHCLNTYINYKSSWEGIQRRGMLQDLSWDNAAQHYEQVLLAAKYQW